MPPARTEQALAADSDDVGHALLALAEDQWFDRKSQRIAPRDLANDLLGFGNADGGIVVVGLWRGRVEGTDRGEAHRNALMQAGIDFIQPALRTRTRLVPCRRDDGGEDHLLVFELEPADVVLTNVRDEVYLRVGDETRRLSFSQREELLFDKGQASYEARPVAGGALPDLDEALVANYANAVGAEDPTRMLEARGLVRADLPTIAGCLLFFTAPQAHLPEAFIRVLRYRGRDRGAGARQQLLVDHKIDGPIPRALLEARDVIRANQPVRLALTPEGRFGDVPLVPEDAWLEGLVNAVVHRSYSLVGDHIRFEIFDDRIEVSSPGRFPGIVDISDPLHVTRFARNPRIARVCADLQFGQELGEGIRRMFEEMRLVGLTDPLYRQTAGSVHLTLSSEPVDRRLDARLPEEVRLITAALRKTERLSTGEVVELLGVSRPTALTALRDMQDAGIIRWVGRSPKDPRAYWTLNR